MSASAQVRIDPDAGRGRTGKPSRHDEEVVEGIVPGILSGVSDRGVGSVVTFFANTNSNKMQD